MVRAVLATGTVIHFEGDQGAERRVRLELACGGQVLHYEGEKGTERMVRLVLATGIVIHFEGEKGAERIVPVESGTKRAAPSTRATLFAADPREPRSARDALRHEAVSSVRVAAELVDEAERLAERNARLADELGRLRE